MVPFRLPIEETLTIEKLVYGGEGLARQEGKVILMPFVLPGEVVRAEIDRAKNDLWRGRLLEVLQPSPSRITPGCPYFQRCGGCQYQHIDYAFQLEQKREILREVLQRVGQDRVRGRDRSRLGRAVAVSQPRPASYRRRQGRLLRPRFARSLRHRSLPHCVASAQRGHCQDHALAVIGVSTAVELFTNETDVQVNVLDRVPRQALAALAALGVTTPIDYGGFRVSRNSFFQVNRFLIDRWWSAPSRMPEANRRVDLYAGVGLFSVKLAERFSQGDRRRIERGAAFAIWQHNFRIEQMAAVNANVEDYLAGLQRNARFHPGRPAARRSRQTSW